MKIIKNFLTAFFLVGATTAWAQSFHPSSEEEFVGRWKMLPFPIEQQPQESRANPFIKGECIYFLHDSDGTWTPINIQNLAGQAETIRQCDLSFKQLDAHKAAAGPSKLRWKKNDKVFFVSDTTGNGYMWSAIVIDADGQATFADPKSAPVVMKRGDLLMQLANLKTNGIAWRVLLRRVPE